MAWPTHQLSTFHPSATEWNAIVDALSTAQGNYNGNGFVSSGWLQVNITPTANTDGLAITPPALVATGTQSGGKLRLRANAYDSSNHMLDFYFQPITTSNAGVGRLALFSSLDGAGPTEIWSIDRSGGIRGPSPWADIRAWGTVVSDDTTDNHVAFDAAVASGAYEIRIPAHTLIVKDSIPANIFVRGESMITSVIATTNPSTVVIGVGVNTVLDNLALRHAGVPLTSSATRTAPIGRYYNMRDVTDNPVMTGYTPLCFAIGQTGLDLSGTNILNYGLGDGVYVGNYGAGVGIRADLQAGTGQAILIDINGGTGGAGLQVLENIRADAVTPFSFFSPFRQGGSILSFTHRTSTFAGVCLSLSMADISGSFTGLFESFATAGVTKWTVDSGGNATSVGVIKGGAITSGTSRWSTGAGSPNGVVTGSPGDLYTNISGGANTTFYAKESGTATNTGWVAK